MEKRGKVLIVRVGAIGDICMAIPVVHALSRTHDVHWLIREKHKPIVESFPEVRCRLIGVSIAPDDERAPDDLIAALKAKQFDALVDLSHWRPVADLARRLADIPVRAVTRDPEQDMLLGLPQAVDGGAGAFNRVVDVPAGAHQVEKWRVLIEAALGVDAAPDWRLPELKSRDAGGVLRIFLHAHASKPEKIWPAAHFAEVLAGLSRQRRISVTVNDADRATTRRLLWRLFLARVPARKVPLDPTFQGMRQALSEANIAIGCDSGPLQFASLMGVPSVVVYGRYPVSEFGPLFRSVAVSPRMAGVDAEEVPVGDVRLAISGIIAAIEGGRLG